MAEKDSKISVPLKKPRRGEGLGSNFFAVEMETLQRLFEIDTASRLQLVLCYLVLAAGTGSDHRLTKWSAKACEDHVGIGTPRAKRAIAELIAAGIIELSPAATRMSPQYILPEIKRAADPIFLPKQLVTGFADETPILRRVREVGDPLLLHMLLHLYFMVQLDATFSVPLQNLKTRPSEAVCAFEAGVHKVWALKYSGSNLAASGEWCRIHYVKAKSEVESWQPFWDRLSILQKIGAVWFEPWLYDGSDESAEPILPVDFAFQYETPDRDDTTELTSAIYEAAWILAGDRTYLLEQSEADLLVPLPAHHRKPSLIGVAKLRVEADTPGRRRSFAKRQDSIEGKIAAYRQLASDARAGRLNQPLGSFKGAAV